MFGPAVHQRESAMCTHSPSVWSLPPLPPSHSSRPSQSPELRPLCYMTASRSLSGTNSRLFQSTSGAQANSRLGTDSLYGFLGSGRQAEAWGDFGTGCLLPATPAAELSAPACSEAAHGLLIALLLCPYAGPLAAGLVTRGNGIKSLRLEPPCLSFFT